MRKPTELSMDFLTYKGNAPFFMFYNTSVLFRTLQTPFVFLDDSIIIITHCTSVIFLF